MSSLKTLRSSGCKSRLFATRHFSNEVLFRARRKETEMGGRGASYSISSRHIGNKSIRGFQ